MTMSCDVSWQMSYVTILSRMFLTSVCNATGCSDHIVSLVAEIVLLFSLEFNWFICCCGVFWIPPDHAHKSILTITNNTLQKKILTWMTPKHKTIYLIILQILVMKKIASFRIIETEQDNQWWTSLSVRLWLWVGGENLWCQWPLEVDSWWPGPHGHWCHWCHDTYSLVVTLLHQPSHSISMHV